METLTQRQENILRGVVESHIETTGPVGSRYITQRYALPLSSATIRNEMGALEEMGYLTHPHTSSGRIPTDYGYRYYLDHTTFDERLPEQVCNRVSGELDPRHFNFDPTEGSLDRISSLLSSVLQPLPDLLVQSVGPRCDSFASC